jgi:phage baseplate assembly protein V
MGDRRTWQRLLGPIWRRIRLIISRGVLKLVDDSLKLQGVQLGLLGDEPAWAERFQEYGFTSHPLKGAEAVVGAVGGARSHLVALAVDDRRYRVKDLQAGEVCLYTDEGDEIRFKRGKIISVKAGSEVNVTAGDKATVTAPEIVATASTSIKLDTPIVTATQDLTVTGKCTVLGALAAQGGMTVSGGSGAAASIDGLVSVTDDVEASGVSLVSHTHPENDGGDTGAPN